MVTAKKPNRHLTRQCIFQALFEADFRDNDPLANFNRVVAEIGSDIDAVFGRRVIQVTKNRQSALDEKLLEAAPDWPIEKVSKVDKVIIRSALSELLFKDEIEPTPDRVVINEAVEIAKRFGSESSSRFVNGVLGTIYRKYIENKPTEETDE